jgi:hypothetical protein
LWTTPHQETFTVDLFKTISFMSSAVAAMEGGKPTIIPNAEGARTTPSVVAFTKKGEKLVGQIAKRQVSEFPSHVFRLDYFPNRS